MRVWLAALVALAACSGDDGGPAPARDAGPADAPTLDASFGVQCTDVFCSIPDRFCCADQLVPPMVSRFCLDQGEENLCMGTSYFCDGPEDCEGNDVCCTNSATGEHRCTDLGTCLGQGSVVCHITAHCPAAQACIDTPLGIIRACQ